MAPSKPLERNPCFVTIDIGHAIPTKSIYTALKTVVIHHSLTCLPVRYCLLASRLKPLSWSNVQRASTGSITSSPCSLGLKKKAASWGKVLTALSSPLSSGNQISNELLAESWVSPLRFYSHETNIMRKKSSHHCSKWSLQIYNWVIGS